MSAGKELRLDMELGIGELEVRHSRGFDFLSREFDDSAGDANAACTTGKA